MFFSDQNRPFLQPRCKDLGRRGAREDHGDQVAASVDKKQKLFLLQEIVIEYDLMVIWWGFTGDLMVINGDFMGI